MAPENAATGPAPQVYSSYNPGNSRCEEIYPFACVDKDEHEIGAEVTTIYRLLAGTYEYWIELDSQPDVPDGEMAVVLKNRSGRVVRQWARRADPAVNKLGWHVFDVDGRDGRVTTVDAVLTQAPLYLPKGAHDPYTLVCPNNA